MARWSNLIDWTFDNADFNIDFAPYQKAFDLYSQSGNVVPLSSEQVADDLIRIYGFKKSDRQREYLIDLIDRLPQGFRFGIKTMDAATSTFLSRVNFLQINSQFLDAWNSVSSELPSQANAKTFSKIINDVDKEIEQKFVNLEATNLSNSGEADQVQGKTNEELVATLGPVVRASQIDSPFARATNVQVEESATGGAVTSASVTGSPDWIGSDESPDTWNEYLRLTPSSTVYDLQQFDTIKSGDEDYSEGFDATMFSGWLSSKTKDEVNAKREDGTPVKWSASTAIKFIYDLSDQGNTAKINELQNMLRQAGYFAVLGEGGALPIPGVVDSSMEQAWGLFLTDAARLNKTPAELFKMKTTQFKKMTTTGEGLVGEDIAGISQNIDSLAFEILGRRLSPTEKQSLYGAVRGWEREQLATQLYDKQPTTVDIDARLAQLIERENANEVAFNVGESMNTKFRKWYGD